MREPGSIVAVDFGLGLLVGVGVGLAIGLLSAPVPGRDSRAWLLVRSAAVRRNTAEFLHARGAMDVVRQRGVVGLMDLLRHRHRSGDGAAGHASQGTNAAAL